MPPSNEDIHPFTYASVYRVSIGSDDGLWFIILLQTNAGLLSIGPLGTDFSELIEIHAFSFKKMHLKMLSGKRRR